LDARELPPLPPELAPYFQCPPQFANQLGDYRSPLIFADGAKVQTPADWQRRRAEIRAAWDEAMGAWPARLTKPRIELIAQIEREGFQQRKVRVEIAKDEMADAFILVPAGDRATKRAAIVVPFYEPETSIGANNKSNRDFAYQLTKRGFVTLALGSPGGDARLPETGGARCQPLSYLGYVADSCAAALASLPEVDAERIGIVGHSYGGKWAMFGSCLSDRFACAAWSDPGIVFDEKRPNVNYWDPWYLGAEEGSKRPVGLPDETHPRTGAYQKLIEHKMDLHELHALMAPRPFLVSGGSEDQPARWIALNHSIAVNRLLGFNDRVGMTNRPAHDPTVESNEIIYRFFEHVLGNAEGGTRNAEK